MKNAIKITNWNLQLLSLHFLSSEQFAYIHVTLSTNWLLRQLEQRKLKFFPIIDGFSDDVQMKFILHSINTRSQFQMISSEELLEIVR